MFVIESCIENMFLRKYLETEIPEETPKGSPEEILGELRSSWRDSHLPGVRMQLVLPQAWFSTFVFTFVHRCF